MPATRILIVDDSSAIRTVTSSLLSEEADLLVVGMAPNGRIGVEKIAQVQPDVVLLDIEMPVMDGMTALKQIRKDHPKLPVIMFSALTKKGATQTLEALALGADDYVAKPSMAANLEEAMANCKKELLPKIRSLHERHSQENKAGVRMPSAKPAKVSGSVDLVVLSAGMGGPTAFMQLLPKFAATCSAPIIVVQSMLPTLVRPFVERLQSDCQMKVLETGDLQPLLPAIYVATSGKHTVVERQNGKVQIHAYEGPAENTYLPSVDVLLRSASRTLGGNCLVGIMSGIGTNGLEGCKTIRACGGEIIVQDRESSSVWGLPSAVVEAGFAHGIYPLNNFYEQISQRILASKSTPVLAAP